jgi:hypothetical protein
VADGNEISSDIKGIIIAVWGDKREPVKAPYFEKDQIAELCDFLLEHYKQ